MLLVAAVDDKDVSLWLQSGLALMARMSGVQRKVYIQVEDIDIQAEDVYLYLEDVRLQGKDNLLYRDMRLFP